MQVQNNNNNYLISELCTCRERICTFCLKNLGLLSVPRDGVQGSRQLIQKRLHQPQVGDNGNCQNDELKCRQVKIIAGILAVLIVAMLGSAKPPSTVRSQSTNVMGASPAPVKTQPATRTRTKPARIIEMTGMANPLSI